MTSQPADWQLQECLLITGRSVCGIDLFLILRAAGIVGLGAISVAPQQCHPPLLWVGRISVHGFIPSPPLIGNEV